MVAGKKVDTDVAGGIIRRCKIDLTEMLVSGVVRQYHRCTTWQEWTTGKMSFKRCPRVLNQFARWQIRFSVTYDRRFETFQTLGNEHVTVAVYLMTG